MSLLDSYLAAVRSYLPPTAKDDIIEELRDELRSQAEAWEQQRGEPLSEQDWHKLLLQAGHPASAAAKFYEAEPLLGNHMSGLFWLALKPLAYILIGVYTAIAVFNVFAGQNLVQAVIQGASQASWAFVFGIGALVLTLAVLERRQIRLNVFGDWHPSRLPRDPKRYVIARSESMFEIIFGVIFITWWLGRIEFMHMFPIDHLEFDVSLSTAWHPYFYPILMLSIIELGAALINFAHPVRTRMKAIARLTVSAVTLFIAYQLWMADALLTVTGPTDAVENFARVKYWMERSVDLILVAIVVVYLFEIGSDLRLLLSKPFGRIPAEKSQA